MRIQAKRFMPRRWMRPGMDLAIAQRRAASRSSNRAGRWIWLIEYLAQVPRHQGYALVLLDQIGLRRCVQCGRETEPLAQRSGSLLCQRCAQVQVRHHIVAEHCG